MQNDIPETHAPALAVDPRAVIESVATMHEGLPEWVEELVRQVGEKLNRTDIHFAAELVQNAEDAGNRSDQPRVELRFLIEEGRIIAQNDGLPFNQGDAEAICRAAASSKRHAPDQIGFLGVGFKSVFKITDAPEVHSNGFHFRITRYIHPSWLDDPAPLPAADMSSAFVFPVKPSVNLEILGQEFDHLKPTLLLFLKKLKSIAIDNRITGQTSIVELRDDGAGNAILESLQGQQRWRIVTLAEWQPPRDLRPSEREKHDTIEIRAAFALTDEGQFERLIPSLFFAFLPTEQETGLGFHLQADFVPTLSRESIEESAWNRAILVQAAVGLVQQLCLLRDEGRHGVDLYNLMPLQEEAHDIAAIVANEACTLAQDERLVLTQTQGWLAASDAFIPLFAELRELLTADDLSQHYGWTVDFVHLEVLGRALTVVERLGVDPFGIPDLVEVLAGDENISERSPSWLVKLLIFLYEQRDQVSPETLHQLRQIKLLPLEAGGYAAADSDASGRPVYLPLKSDLSSSYELFSTRLDLVARSLVEAAVAAGYSEQILRAIRWLGVKPFEPAIVIDEIILPIFEGEEAAELDQPQHLAYLDFVRRHWLEYRQPRSESAEDAQLSSDRRQRAAITLRFRAEGEDGKLVLAADLALGNAYAAEENLEQHLQALACVLFISDQYAKAEKKASKKKQFAGPSWREFLCDLGALDHLDVVRIVDTIILPQFKGKGLTNNWFHLTNFIRLHLDDFEREQRKTAPKANDLFAPLRTQLWAASTQRQPVWNFYHPGALYLPEVQDDDFDILAVLSPVISHYFIDCDEYVKQSKADQNSPNADDLRKSWLSLFKRLGAQVYTPASLIENVILPAYEQGKWELLDAGQRLQALDFVRRHYPAFVNAMRQKGTADEETDERLGQALRFLARSEDSTHHLASELFLSQVYAPEDNLEQLLTGLPRIQFIHDGYAEHTRNKPLVGPSWKEFLGKLGAIYRFDVVQIIDQIILPQFAGDNIPDGWFELTDFIRQHLIAYEDWHKRQEEGKYPWERKNPLAKLQEELWLESTCVRDGIAMFELPSSLYRSRPYWGNSDVQLAFGDLLSDKYLSETYWKRSVEGKNEGEYSAIGQLWRQFFEKIGILEYLPLDERKVEDAWSYPGNRVTWTYVSGTRSVSIHDHWNPIFEELFKNLATAKRSSMVQARALLRMLNRHWDHHYQPYLHASYHYFYYSPHSKEIPSAFAALLRANHWVPTLANTLVAPGTKLFTRGLEEHIGDPIQVCAEEVRSANLRSFLNIHDKLTVDDVLELLEKAKAKDAPVAAQMQALYKWLQEEWPKLDEATKSRVVQAFEERELIFFADEQSSWLTSRQCTWQASPLKLVADHIPSLATSYDGLRALFVDYLKVDESPTLSDTLDVIVALQGSQPLAETLYKEVYACYAELEQRLSDPSQSQTLENHRNEPIWLCTDGRLRPTSEVYIHDNVTLLELFDSAVHCLWLPAGTPFGALEQLWSTFGVNRLSEAVPSSQEQQFAAATGFSDQWSQRLQLMIEHVVRYLYTYQHGIFQKYWADGSVERLYRLKVVAVKERIAVSYRLPHGETESSTQPIFIALDRGVVYLIPDLQLGDFALAQELVRVLSADRELQNFIESILLRLDDPNLSHFIKQKNLTELPQEVAGAIANWVEAATTATQGDSEYPVPDGPTSMLSSGSPPEFTASASGPPSETTTSAENTSQEAEKETRMAEAASEICDETDVAQVDQPTSEALDETGTLSQAGDGQDQPVGDDSPASALSSNDRIETLGENQPLADDSPAPASQNRSFSNEVEHRQDLSGDSAASATPQLTDATPAIAQCAGLEEAADADAEDGLSPETGAIGSADESKFDESETSATASDESTRMSSHQSQQPTPAPQDDASDSDRRREEKSDNGSGAQFARDTDSRGAQESSSSSSPKRGTSVTPKGRSRRTSARPRQTTREDKYRPRLRSYVEHRPKDSDHHRDDSGKEESQAERERIAQAGIRAARKYEEAHGRIVKIHAHNHKGWDIDALDSGRRQIIRRIEVKATRYAWDGWGIGLTAAEFEAARQYGDEYFLYVVERALDPEQSRIHIFQNPAKLVSEYRFDDQWKSAALDTRILIEIRNPRDLTGRAIDNQCPVNGQHGQVVLTAQSAFTHEQVHEPPVELLRQAIGKSMEAGKGARLSIVGSVIQQLQPGFSPTKYGHPGILAMIKALPGDFEVIEEGKGLFWVRVRAK